MIKTFSEIDFSEDIEDQDVDYESLQEETKNFDVFGVCEMIDSYFGLVVSEDLVKKVILKDLTLASEVYLNSYEDTSARDMFIDAILREVGLTRWPMNGDSEVYKTEFYEKLGKICNDATSGLKLENYDSI